MTEPALFWELAELSHPDTFVVYSTQLLMARATRVTEWVCPYKTEFTDLADLSTRQLLSLWVQTLCTLGDRGVVCAPSTDIGKRNLSCSLPSLPGPT